MKNIVLFILFLVGINNNFQKEFSGKVIYGFKANEQKKDDKVKRAEIFDQLIKMSEGINFSLKFNRETSVFNIEDKMTSGYNKIGYEYAKNIVGKGVFYFNLKEFSLVKEIDFYGDIFLIKLDKKSETKDWVLTSESKIIGKFTCYKAVKKKIVKNQKGEFVFDIIAWYTPEIPFGYGPKEYNGLPGLILELKDTHNTFFAKKIELNPKNKFRVKKFKEGKKITQTEYNKMVKEALSMLTIKINRD